MRLTNIISKNYINPSLTGKDKVSVLMELSELVSNQIKTITKEEVLKVLEEREKLGSTGIGYGIGIPHGKLNNLESIVLFCAKSNEGVDFDSLDGHPVKIFFLLLAPENSVGKHLKALARISRITRDVEFRNNLINCQTPDEIYKTIVAEDEKIPI